MIGKQFNANVSNQAVINAAAAQKESSVKKKKRRKKSEIAVGSKVRQRGPRQLAHLKSRCRIKKERRGTEGAPSQGPRVVTCVIDGNFHERSRYALQMHFFRSASSSTGPFTSWSREHVGFWRAMSSHKIAVRGTGTKRDQPRCLGGRERERE
jgi:hypothetical protein